MSNNPSNVNNFEDLMRLYLKDKDQIIKNYDYQSPLKEISPIDPLLFKNEIFSNNNKSNNNQNINPMYNDDINKNISNNTNKRKMIVDNINNNMIDNKFITPSKPSNKNISNINYFINSSIEREKEAKQEKKKKTVRISKDVR